MCTAHQFPINSEFVEMGAFYFKDFLDCKPFAFDMINFTRPIGTLS